MLGGGWGRGRGCWAEVAVFQEKLSKTWGCSEGPGDKSWRKSCSSLAYHRAPGSFSVLMAQELLCHPELMGRPGKQRRSPGGSFNWLTSIKQWWGTWADLYLRAWEILFRASQKSLGRPWWGKWNRNQYEE